MNIRKKLTIRENHILKNNKQQAEELRHNDETRLARHEYHRIYRQTKKATMINSIYIQNMMMDESLEMQVMQAMVR